MGLATHEHGSAALGPRQTIGTRRTIPAPTKGLNTRDAFAAMDPDYAIKLDNYFPDSGAVRLRNGYIGYAKDMGSGYVEGLVPHYSGTVEKFFAFAGGSMYDITGDGSPTVIEVGAAVKTGLSSNIVSSATAGNSTIIVNNEDVPMRVQANGTLASDHGWDTPGDNPLPVMRRVTLFKHRVYFLQKDSTKVWYGGVDHVQGDLAEIDLAWVAPEGGNVLEVGTMTIDAGSGIDDLLLFFMENGVVLAYRGIDPAATDESGFFIIGKFKIGALIGDSPLVNFGGDLIVLTSDGAVSMSKILQIGRSQTRRTSLSDTVASIIRDQASIYGKVAGWDSIVHYPSSWLLFNIPIGEQYVMNTQTGAWCRFLGMDARCWMRFNDKLYFGGAGGIVYEANRGGSDDDGPIEGDVQTAYNYFGTAQDKRITMTRSVVESDASVQFQLGSTVDFGQSAELNAPTSIQSIGTAWATSTKATGKKWAVGGNTTGNKWGAGVVQLRAWQPTNLVGSALSIRLRSSTQNAKMSLYATDVITETAPSLL